MLIKKKLNYTLNYKPFLGYQKNLKNNKLIYCKNFFLFFLILDNLALLSKNPSYSIKINKKITNNISFLRAPNKYKKAQIKINLIRYNVYFECIRYYNLSISNTYTDKIYYKFLFNFINFLFNFINFFESTLFYLKKKQICIKLDFCFIQKLFEL